MSKRKKISASEESPLLLPEDIEGEANTESEHELKAEVEEEVNAESEQEFKDEAEEEANAESEQVLKDEADEELNAESEHELKSEAEEEKAAESGPAVSAPPEPPIVEQRKVRAVRVVHDFPIPYNGQVVNFKKGDIIEDPVQVRDLLDANCPVVDVSAPDHLCCPKCHSSFDPELEPEKAEVAVLVIHDFRVCYNQQVLGLKKDQIIADRDGELARYLFENRCPVRPLGQHEYVICGAPMNNGAPCFHHFLPR